MNIPIMTMFPRSRNIVQEMLIPFSTGAKTDVLYKIMVLSTSQLKRTPERARIHAETEIRTELTATTSGFQMHLLNSKLLRPQVSGGFILVCPTGICSYLPKTRACGTSTRLLLRSTHCALPYSPK